MFPRLRSRSRRNASYRCSLECLEDRCLPSGSPPATEVQFESATREAAEGSWGVEIAVRRTGDLQTPSTVGYVVEGVTATPGVDFSADPGTLTFGPGVDRATFTVWVPRDFYGEVEGDETVRITLQNPRGAALGGISTATLTIKDTDRPWPAWSLPVVSGPELVGVVLRRRGKAARWVARVRFPGGSLREVASSLRKGNCFGVGACPHDRNGDGIVDSVRFVALQGTLTLHPRNPKQIIQIVGL